MLSVAQLRDRYSAFVAIVSRRLESTGRNPADVLVIVPEFFELAAVTVTGQPVMFAMYLETALQNEEPLERVADRFVGGWLRQIAIDEARHQSFSFHSAGGKMLSGEVVQTGHR
jgi:hypothetical protein